MITLRRVALYSGALGALLLLVFCRPVARLTFGDDRHAVAVALLALAAFFGEFRPVKARGPGDAPDCRPRPHEHVGALYGTVFSILIVYFFGQDGLVPALVCVAGMGILTSWWYARKIKVEAISDPVPANFAGSFGPVETGSRFDGQQFDDLRSGYLIRVLVLHKIGVDAAGHYNAAWIIGGYYTNFILTAMAMDFYPRLTAVAHDNVEGNRLVNEQMEVGLLIAGPGVLATLTFAPLVMELFYSAKFGPAVEILRWFCLGMILRVASWPMGFILLAKNERKLFFWSELFSNVLGLGLTWIGLTVYGLNGSGMAFFALYLVYFSGIYLIVRRLCGFRVSAANRRLGLLFAPLIAVVFLSWYYLPHPVVAAFGAVAALVVGVYSLKILCTLVPLERFPKPVRKMILLFRLAPPPSNGEPLLHHFFKSKINLTPKEYIHENSSHRLGLRRASAVAPIRALRGHGPGSGH